MVERPQAVSSSAPGRHAQTGALDVVSAGGSCLKELPVAAAA